MSATVRDTSDRGGMARKVVLCLILTLGTLNASVVFKWGTSCYLGPADKRSFDQAREGCRQRFGELVVMETKQEHTALWEHFGRNRHPFWVGGTVCNENEEFAWVNNITIVPDLWLPGKPDVHGRCIRWRMVNDTRGLANSLCDRLMRYICERGRRSVNDVPYQSAMIFTQQEMTSTARDATVTSTCPCVCSSSVRTISKKHFTELYAHLRIAKTLTGNAIRKLTSAADHRISSIVIGYSAICVITVPIGVIVLCDILTIYINTIKIKKNNIIDDK